MTMSRFYVCLFGVQQGPSVTNSWLVGFAINLVQDVLLFSPIHILFFNFFLVGLIKKKLVATVDSVREKLKKIDAKQVSNLFKFQFNALPFFSGSFRAAVLNPDLFGSKVILHQESDIAQDSSKKKSIFSVDASLLFVLSFFLLLPESTQVF